MACGAPVIFMYNGPGPEGIDHNVDGFLCDTRNPRKLSEMILHAIDNLSIRLAVGRKAASRVREQLSINHIVQENISMYKKVIEKHG